MPSTNRRNFLKNSATTSTIGAAWAFGLLNPEAILANWPKSAFEAKEVPQVLNNLYGADVAENHPAVHIKVPEIAENGAVVPVTIEVKGLENVTQIALFASVNPSPLAADFRLTEYSIPYASTRIKMNKTGDIIAVVLAGDKLYSAQKSVKVTIGGCGG